MQDNVRPINARSWGCLNVGAVILGRPVAEMTSLNFNVTQPHLLFLAPCCARHMLCCSACEVRVLEISNDEELRHMEKRRRLGDGILQQS
jgi:hypothetical protein